jgi:hypothetical protein
VKEHSAWLAVLCLHILCDAFAVVINVTGYLLKLSKRKARCLTVTIPEIDVPHISEGGWYAVKFWSIHIIKVVKLNQEIIKMLHTFFSKHLITWVEVLTMKESYKSLIPVRRWLHVSGVEYFTPPRILSLT